MSIVRSNASANGTPLPTASSRLTTAAPPACSNIACTATALCAYASVRVGCRECGKGGFEPRQREQRGCAAHARPLGLGFAALEPNGQAFVEPERHTAGRDAVHERVRELVGQHALEFGRVGERSLHRHPDAPVVGAAGPVRRLRDVAELFPRVEDDRDHLGWIREERRPDSEIRGFENRDRTVGEVRFGGSFEQDGEVVGQLAMEAAVKIRLFAPGLQLLDQPRMARCVDQRRS